MRNPSETSVRQEPMDGNGMSVIGYVSLDKKIVNLHDKIRFSTELYEKMVFH